MSSNFLPILRFIAKTMVHKAYVIRFGLKTKAPLFRLIIHDWTKFTPAELPHYARRHYGANDDKLGFALAWNHHSKSNRHHWEWYVPVTGHRSAPDVGGKPLPMPEKVVREMVADWLAASTAYQGIVPTSVDDWEWFQKEKDKLRLHTNTWVILNRVLAEYFAKS